MDTQPGAETVTQTLSLLQGKRRRNKLRYRSYIFVIEVFEVPSISCEETWILKCVDLRFNIKILSSISKFLKIFDIAYTTSILKLVHFDIEVLRYRVLYSILVHFNVEVLNFDVELELEVL